MPGKLFQSLRLYLRQEPGADRWQRMWVCAVVGILASTLYAWTISTINLVTLPGQQLALDWQRLWFYWGGLSIIAGVEGLFAGWFTENHEGISFGWMPVELLLLSGYFVYLSLVSTDPLAASISIIGLLEMTGALILLAAVLRLTANQFIQIRASEERAARWKRSLLFSAVMICLVLLIDSLARYDISVVRALRSFNDSLSGAATDASLESRLPLESVPGLRSHLGQPYVIVPRPATQSVGAYVFAVVYPDGFSFSCPVSITESQQVYYFTVCSPGADLSFP